MYAVFLKLKRKFFAFQKNQFNFLNNSINDYERNNIEFN